MCIEVNLIWPYRDVYSMVKVLYKETVFPVVKPQTAAVTILFCVFSDLFFDTSCVVTRINSTSCVISGSAADASSQVDKDRALIALDLEP